MRRHASRSGGQGFGPPGGSGRPPARGEAPGSFKAAGRRGPGPHARTLEGEAGSRSLQFRGGSKRTVGLTTEPVEEGIERELPRQALEGTAVCRPAERGEG